MPHSFKASTAWTRAARSLYGFSLLVVGCTWDPSARPIQPELVFEGAARVDALLGQEGRYALVQAGTVTAGTPQAEGIAPGSGVLKHFRLVDSQGLSYCSLPPEYVPLTSALSAPSLQSEGAAKLWLPLRVGDPASAAGAQLYFSNERCELKGPVAKVNRPTRFTLRADGREVLFSLLAGELSIIDPWSDTVHLVAREVEGYQLVEADNTASAQTRQPEAVWLLEGPRLTQRALNGTLLLSLGREVQDFVQQRFVDGLRIAFRDGNDLFEAKGPDFAPVLIAEDACDATYRSTSLDLHFPCKSRQLVRIELLTGTVRRFAPGVTDAFTIGDIEVERARGEGGQEELYVASKGGPRARVLPIPRGTPSMLGGAQLAGLAIDRRFGVWNMRGEFTEVLSGVEDLRTFRGARNNDLAWLILYDRQGDVARMATFTQRDLERALSDRAVPLALEAVAEGVPVQGGFSIVPGIGAEPVVLTLEQATRLPEKPFSGTLYARLLSGTLEARIDEGVSSNLLVVTPQPAILYGISEGARSGLWFAAL